MKQAKGLLDNVEYSSDPYACAEGADALVICTEWTSFARSTSIGCAHKLRPILVDLRNIYRPAEMAAPGFHLRERVGRAGAQGERGSAKRRCWRE